MQQPNTGELIGGRYRLSRLIGQGGMGAVHVAQDRLTGQIVALKRVHLPPEQLAFNSRGGSDLYLALAGEFRIMASLRHPHVNSVLDYGFDAQRRPFFTMDLLENPQSIFRAGWKSDQDKVAVLVQTLMALAYLHRRGVIHRDLKPANLLVVNGQVKVLDFGLSVLVEQAQPETIAGTLGYIAPELLLGDLPSATSDLYAVGVIGYELLTGKPIIESDDTEVLINQTLQTTFVVESIANRALAAVIARMIVKDPQDRYVTAQDAITALCAAIGQPVPRESAAIRESFLQTARFVGRETEMRQLGRALLEAQERRGRVWLVGGESGSGKTRLIDELRIQAMVQGATTLRGQNIAQGASPYQMWRGPLRTLALTASLNDADASVLKALVPDMGDLLERQIKDAPDVNPMFAQERLVLSIENVLKGVTGTLFIVLEDLHWAGRESLDLLARLVTTIRNLPILIMATYRDDEMPGLSIPGAKALKLARLTDESIAELSAAMLGPNGRQPQLIELLRRETEGNPLFLVEVMRALAEQAGRLDQIASMSLPAEVSAKGIDQIIRRRLERVPAEDRPLLRFAALYGRRLDLVVLERLAPAETPLTPWLLTCQNTAVLEVQDNIYQFSHDKLREGVLAEVAAGERPMMHRQIADALEATSSDYAMLGYHWGMAGDLAKEAYYRALTGKLALGSGAYDIAVENLERALVLEAPTPESLKQWINLKRLAADAYLGLGDRSAAERLYSECLRAYQDANYKWGVASALNDLGFLAVEGRAPLAAEGRFRDALQTALPIRAWTVALASVIGLAALIMERGELARAAELTALTLNHMSVDHQTADRATRLLNRIRIDLPAPALAEAEARGREARLAEVAAQLAVE